MGTTGDEIQRMLERVGIRVARREYRGSRSGLYTAATVFASALAAAAVRGLPLAGCRVAIEGYGRVGRPLAEMFARAGAKVVAISNRHGGLYSPVGLDVAAVAERVCADGDAAVAAGGLGDRIAASDLKFVPAEIFCPCARHESITDGAVGAVEAKVISCGANSPITPAAERRLWERGIVCVPDFVANSGGVLGGTMEFAGWRPAEILDFCDQRFRPRVASLIQDALREGRSLRSHAEDFALRRFSEVKRLAERDSWRRGGVDAALAAYRAGWVPGRLVRRMSVGYFESRVG
jgi:glutamate dehydrogenase/leucine dehydrogenase